MGPILNHAQMRRLPRLLADDASLRDTGAAIILQTVEAM
jgi:hypothetical protein